MTAEKADKKHKKAVLFPIRRTARKWVISLLYQRDIREEYITEEMRKDFYEQACEWETRIGKREYRKITNMTEKYWREIIPIIQDLDRFILEKSQNWRWERMALVDRNIMRTAIYEMRFREDIPPAVSMNEAIDIAKCFGSEKSGMFINGILDKHRPASTFSGRKNKGIPKINPK